MNRYILIIICLLSFFYSTTAFPSCGDCHAATTVMINEVAVEKAKTYLHVREKKNDNRSPEIDKFHRLYGLPYGNPWCMMFVGNSYYEAFTTYNMRSPIPKIARVCLVAKYASNRPLEFKTISTKKLVWGADRLEMGDMVIFKHGQMTNVDTFSWDGHIEIGISESNKKYNCIGGNTKPKKVDGADETGRTIGKTNLGLDGVYIRERTLGLNTNFPIVYIIRLTNRKITLH